MRGTTLVVNTPSLPKLVCVGLRREDVSESPPAQERISGPLIQPRGQVGKSSHRSERSVDAGFVFKDWIERDSDLDSIRHHPRFQALLKRLE